MSKAYISKALRQRVAEQARHRCGYCLTPEAIVGMEMDVDHIFPEALGGQTEEENLWLACTRCNEHKGEQFEAPDPLTDKVVPLFHPREQHWHEHFAWSPESDQIIGLTPVGRATIAALKLNRPLLVASRRLWVSKGLHPPKD